MNTFKKALFCGALAVLGMCSTGCEDMLGCMVDSALEPIAAHDRKQAVRREADFYRGHGMSEADAHCKAEKVVSRREEESRREREEACEAQKMQKEQEEAKAYRQGWHETQASPDMHRQLAAWREAEKEEELEQERRGKKP